MVVSLKNVIDSVKTWTCSILRAGCAGEIEIDNEDCFRASFYCSDDCWAQVIVHEDDMPTPYRYVFFEAVGSKGNKVDTVYIWCDSEEDGISEICRQLNKGITIALNYKNTI